MDRGSPRQSMSGLGWRWCLWGSRRHPAPGDARIKDAAALGEELVNRLQSAGTDQDDIVAIVGVGEGGVLQPAENFTYQPVDANLVKNALIIMRDETVGGGTPLYVGRDEALRLLLENPDARIREVLTHRRKVLIVFSDGIDTNFSDETREGDIATRRARMAFPSIPSACAPPRVRTTCAVWRARPMASTRRIATRPPAPKC